MVSGCGVRTCVRNKAGVYRPKSKPTLRKHPTHMSVHTSIHSIHMTICMPTHISIPMSIHMAIAHHTHVYAHVCTHMSICMSM